MQFDTVVPHAKVLLGNAWTAYCKVRRTLPPPPSPHDTAGWDWHFSQARNDRNAVGAILLGAALAISGIVSALATGPGRGLPFQLDWPVVAVWLLVTGWAAVVAFLLYERDRLAWIDTERSALYKDHIWAYFRKTEILTWDKMVLGVRARLKRVLTGHPLAAVQDRLAVITPGEPPMRLWTSVPTPEVLQDVFTRVLAHNPDYLALATQEQRAEALAYVALHELLYKGLGHEPAKQ